MFWHLYIYRLKVLFKTKILLFWQAAFPIILGTMFYMAFSDISEMTETINTINVVVTAEEGNGENIVDNDQAFDTFLDTMTERELFSLTFAEYDEAIKLVADGEADGALVVAAGQEGTELSLIFGGSGMNQTILKNIINTYEHGAAVIEDAQKNNPVALEEVLNELYSEENLNKDIATTSENMDTYNQYYFALFAMTCMFGASYGILNTQHGQADQSDVGVRRAASPTKKMMMVLSEYLAAVTVVELLFVILLVYMVGVLGIGLGNKYGLILLASFISTLMGVAIGYFFGVIKCKQSLKEGAMMAIIMFLNFLAGLMIGNMKYIIEKACPIVNRINPTAIISDCFYSICVYEDMNMYIRCIASLIIWTVALAVISINILRRQKYANL